MRWWLFFLFTFPVFADRFVFRDEDLLWVAMEYPKKLLVGLTLEKERLVGLCPTQTISCFKKHHRQGIWNLGDIYAGPSKLRTKVGSLSGVTDISAQTGELSFRVDFMPQGGAAPVTWISEVTDPNRKRYLVVPEASGDWVRLPSQPFPENSWIHLAGSGMQGVVESSVHELVRFTTPTTAIDISQKKEVKLEAGVFYFIGVKQGKMLFRKERSSDMLCGNRLTENEVSEKTKYQLPLRVLSDAAGTPRFKLAYPNGCESVFESQSP